MAVLTGVAGATPVLDQQQANHERDGIYVGGPPRPLIVAQIIRSGTAGSLTQVDLFVGCGSSSALVVEIRDASSAPGSTVLATRTISGLTFPNDWHSVPFAGMPFMTKDTPFTVVISSTGNCSTAGGPTTADLYPAGTNWYQETPGVWLGPLASGDLAFRTFVERICQVPRLVGEPDSELARILERYGCALGRTTRAYSQTVPAGEVTSQSLPEGAQLPPDSSIEVVVSLGPPVCIVPNVRRKRLAQAKAAIARARCRVGAIRRVRSSRALRNRVIRQKPSPGTERPPGAHVSLVVGRA